ncbi:cytochrome o ubiquinol oxidase subunit IV [Thioclava sp. JM3]|nr:cytochrome o ubiquinol oxidase subunit IV [Thioclava sp. JM3]
MRCANCPRGSCDDSRSGQASRHQPRSSSRARPRQSRNAGLRLLGLPDERSHHLRTDVRQLRHPAAGHCGRTRPEGFVHAWQRVHANHDSAGQFGDLRHGLSCLEIRARQGRTAGLARGDAGFGGGFCRAGEARFRGHVFRRCLSVAQRLSERVLRAGAATWSARRLGHPLGAGADGADRYARSDDACQDAASASWPVLAFPRHHLDRDLLGRLSGRIGISDRETEFRRERRSYLTGLAFALILTLIPFGVVAWGGLSTSVALWLIAGFALVQIVVHFRFFLHIDLSRQTREDLQLILFTVLLLAIMASGTIWIMASLHTRMM